MNLAKDEKTGLYYRPWCSDLEIIKGVYKQYDIDNFKNTDIVFDLGANIGSFSYRIAKIVEQVFAFEPDPENFKIAVYNNRNNFNVTLFNKAIVGNEDKERYLYKSNSNSEASHSLHKTSRNKRILIPCINYQKMIDQYEPTIIKADIEGEEYYLFHKPLFKNVRIFIAEFHFGKKEWRKSFPIILNSLLNEQKFKPKKEIRLTEKAWHTVIKLWRK